MKTQVLRVDKDTADIIRNLTVRSGNWITKDIHPGKDLLISKTAVFDDGMQMDIKCCGVTYEEGNDNSCWCEAVLFDKNGCEVCCSEIEDDFFGMWELDHNGVTYCVIIIDKIFEIESEYQSEEMAIMNGFSKIGDGLYQKKGCYAKIVGYY